MPGLLTRTPYIDESHLELIRRLRAGLPVETPDPPMISEPLFRQPQPLLTQNQSPEILTRDRPIETTAGPNFDINTILTRNQPVETPPPPPTELLTRPSVSVESPPRTLADLTPPPMPDNNLEPMDSRPLSRTPELSEMPPPPIMLGRHGGHIVSATGGADPLETDRILLRAQQGQEPQKESWKKIAGRGALGFLFGGIPGAASTVAGDLLDRKGTDREAINRDVALTQNRIGQELLTRGKQSDLKNDAARRDLERAQINDRLQKPPESSTRIVSAGEYEGIPAGTEIRQTWNPQQRQMVDAIARNGKPVVAKAAKESPAEFITNDRDEVMLAPKDGGPARPVFDLNGNPLKKKVSGSGNVQTGHRLATDGITVIQTQRDPASGQWVDSIGPDGGLIRMGQVGRIDSATGAPVSTLIDNNRVVERQQQENERKRAAYESESQEWGNKERTFRQNKTSEDQSIKEKQGKIRDLYAEKRSWTPQLLGGRSTQEIQSDIDRLSAEIKTHRGNSQSYQKQADEAAGKATAARRNAGLNAGSPPAQSPRGAKPGRIQPNEDPQVRDYANEFFGGNYQKAQAAIQAQRNKK